MEGLAALVCLSVRHFHRLFVEVTGESPAEHIQRLHLARGAAWLAYTDATVIEAALAAGYESREAFTRLFTSHYGCSPKVFRARARAHLQAVQRRPAPAGLSILDIQDLPAMTMAAWPHFGTPFSIISTWLKVGQWIRSRELHDLPLQPTTIIHDDIAVMTPNTRERLDAALAFDECLFLEIENRILGPHALPTPKGHSDFPIRYHIPAGRYAMADYKGPVSGMDQAWDYFGLVWLMESNLELRDSRFLVLHDPVDIPTGSRQMAELALGRSMTCRLCIPVDGVADNDYPILKLQGNPDRKIRRAVNQVE